MVYVWEKAVKEFHVTLAVEDHHRYVVAVFARSDNPAQVLRNDVAQQGRLSRSGHPQHNSLHHPDTIGPHPWLAMYVVAQHNGILCPGFSYCAIVSVGTHNQRWMGPPPLSAHACCQKQICCGIESGHSDEEIAGQLCDLPAREMVSLSRDVPSEPATR